MFSKRRRRDWPFSIFPTKAPKLGARPALSRNPLAGDAPDPQAGEDPPAASHGRRGEGAHEAAGLLGAT